MSAKTKYENKNEIFAATFDGLGRGGGKGEGRVTRSNKISGF